MTRRILIVDDDESIREIAQSALTIVGGWEVVTAGSGREAFQVALTEQPDAVLLDVMMPGVDGPTTAAGLRANPATRDIPVIFLTAKMSTDQAEEWGQLRLAGVIPKPFDPMILAGNIAKLLGWPA